MRKYISLRLPASFISFFSFWLSHFCFVLFFCCYSYLLLLLSQHTDAQLDNLCLLGDATSSSIILKCTSHACCDAILRRWSLILANFGRRSNHLHARMHSLINWCLHKTRKMRYKFVQLEELLTAELKHGLNEALKSQNMFMAANFPKHDETARD